jgi:hypothetical protein
VLLQSVVEKSGIPAVSISVLMEVTRRVEPPRVLAVDRPLGYPLGEPRNPALQQRIMMSALRLLEREDALPVEEEFRDVPA